MRWLQWGIAWCGGCVWGLWDCPEISAIVDWFSTHRLWLNMNTIKQQITQALSRGSNVL
jgi:hypothetical protein